MKNNAHGFAAIEAILIVVVLAIIGGTGWFVYHSKQVADKTLTNVAAPAVQTKKPVSKTSSPAAAAPSATQKYLVITQWGVKMPLTSDIAEAYYVGPELPAPGVESIYIGTKDLAALDSDCAADGPAFTSITRETSAVHAQNIKSGDQGAAADNNNTAIGNYYYGFNSAQAACSDNESAAQLQLKVNQAFKDAFDHLQQAE